MDAPSKPLSMPTVWMREPSRVGETEQGSTANRCITRGSNKANWIWFMCKPMKFVSKDAR